MLYFQLKKGAGDKKVAEKKEDTKKESKKDTKKK